MPRKYDRTNRVVIYRYIVCVFCGNRYDLKSHERGRLYCSDKCMGAYHDRKAYEKRGWEYQSRAKKKALDVPSITSLIVCKHGNQKDQCQKCTEQKQRQKDTDKIRRINAKM